MTTLTDRRRTKEDLKSVDSASQDEYGGTDKKMRVYKLGELESGSRKAG